MSWIIKFLHRFGYIKGLGLTSLVGWLWKVRNLGKLKEENQRVELLNQLLSGYENSLFLVRETSDNVRNVCQLVLTTTNSLELSQAMSNVEMRKAEIAMIFRSTPEVREILGEFITAVNESLSAAKLIRELGQGTEPSQVEMRLSAIKVVQEIGFNKVGLLENQIQARMLLETDSLRPTFPKIKNPKPRQAK